MLHVTTIKAWSAKNTRVKDSPTVPRPWDDEKPKIATPTEMRRFFGGRVRYTPRQTDTN